MKTYGLTGGLGMGKSAADAILRERGIKVVDTDLLAREIVEPGQPALAEVAQAFGQQFIGADGRLRREELGRAVFADDAARKKLEAILHPRIQARWRRQLEDWRAEGRPQAVVVIPLLFETDAAKEFDAVICVACSAATQRQRLQSRGWNADKIARRIAAQWPIERKMESANFVVWTEGSLDALASQLNRIIP